jgi:hypothetical protein
MTLTLDFDKVKIQYGPRSRNTQADALSKLTALGSLNEKRPIIIMEIPHLSIDLPQSPFAITDGPVEEKWYILILRFLTTWELPTDGLEAKMIKILALMYSIWDNEIYKRGYLQSWLKCVVKIKAQEMLFLVHEDIYDNHQRKKDVGQKILRIGFYWSTLKTYTTVVVWKCENCQFNNKISRIPLYEMISISEAWPFYLWDIDIFGPFLVVVQQRKFILVAAE